MYRVICPWGSIGTARRHCACRVDAEAHMCSLAVFPACLWPHLASLLIPNIGGIWNKRVVYWSSSLHLRTRESFPSDQWHLGGNYPHSKRHTTRMSAKYGLVRCLRTSPLANPEGPTAWSHRRQTRAAVFGASICRWYYNLPNKPRRHRDSKPSDRDIWTGERGKSQSQQIPSACCRGLVGADHTFGNWIVSARQNTWSDVWFPHGSDNEGELDQSN